MAYERYSVYRARAGQSLTLAASEVVLKLDAQPWRSKAATCCSTKWYSSADGRQVDHNVLACLALCMIVKDYCLALFFSDEAPGGHVSEVQSIKAASLEAAERARLLLVAAGALHQLQLAMAVLMLPVNQQ